MSRFTPSIFAPRRSRALTAGAVLAVSAIALAGCSTNEPAEDDGTIAVVASTSVYGNLVATLGGDAVSVTSLVDNAAQDPHSYEASARDQLAVSEADLVVLNGGGYDPFAEALYEASGASAVLIHAVDSSGLLDEGEEHDHVTHDAATEGHEEIDHSDDVTSDGTDDAADDAADDHAEDDHAEDDGHDHIEGFNEHVWYSFHAMEHIAEQITAELSTLSPENSGTFDAALESFLSDLDTLDGQAEELSVVADGRGAAITEPVAVYLLENVGLHNDTPAAFTEAIEEGSDVPPTALRDVLALVEDDHIALLAYNEQTASPETERVRQAAEEAGLPVVSFTETLPEGSDYVEWMSSNLDALAVALG
ncbi:metal ABC transporter solute-binding protein, Zn/Mn family [Salinibacterium sp. M195]|uniref:metal ABC transporter solute-binding protein, Zn/Mn family n=1 Tax=Salinibacterium sp. M195 TaxID=2583374 RepID=UPI001C629BCA|nr:zinc ABC transporter substrate-binding protein [Salinibacterium sp. M195]QYH34914.1 ABC transporter substrate-binding protein [Salinibacterium sp. M195]